ncbi:MAG: FAD binding domain-containing protein [Anaerolineae bacterium]|jgi:carbon-monoxide dehydrogenase medium subunit|nr:FAD binding domain-containing protein [Anaerolineae bacterium]
MLLNLREYHRPGDAEGVAQALKLLSRPDIRTVLLAGGDALVGAADPAVEAVVDLQALAALDFISVDASTQVLRVGVMTTRAALEQYLERETPGALYRVVAEGARQWSGNVQRNRATVGGAIATAAPNDPLVVALLACNAQVTLMTLLGPRTLSMSEFLPARAALLAEPALIAEVSVSPDREAAWALASVARTPSDAPIVIAVAMLSLEHGRCAAARVALGGVAEMPIMLPEIATAVVGQIPSPKLFAAVGNRAATLAQPTGDFRGSAEYRRAMAGVLTERALNMAWQMAA